MQTDYECHPTTSQWRSTFFEDPLFGAILLQMQRAAGQTLVAVALGSPVGKLPGTPATCSPGLCAEKQDLRLARHWPIVVLFHITLVNQQSSSSEFRGV